MTPKLTTVGRVTQVAGIKILVHGVAGIGKTKLCGTMPSPVILSAEAGLLSLAKEFPNLPVWVIHTIDDLTEAYQWLFGSADSKKYASVCLDSVSEIAEALLIDLKAGSKDPRQAYGEVQDKIAELLRQFRDLPGRHVYFAAKSEPRTDQDGFTKYYPSFPGKKLGPAVPYLFDEVFHYTLLDHQGTAYRVLRTQPDFQSEAKDRSGALAEIEEPHLGRIIDKIKKYGKAPVQRG